MTPEEARSPKIHHLLEHLTPDQVNEVIQLYYEGTKVEKIAQSYGIELSRAELISVLPPAVLEDIKCPYCDLPMWRDRVSRSWKLEKMPYCPNCRHSFADNCSCINCSRIREEQADREQERKRKILQEVVDVAFYQPVNFETLTLLKRTYLGAALRAGLSEDMSVIKPFDSFDEPLAPTTELRRDIFDELTEDGLLKIHPMSPLDAFTEVKEDGTFRYYIYKVYLHLNVTTENGRPWLLDRLINPPRYDVSESDEVLSLWRNIAVAEAIEYLLYNMEQVGFEFNPGKKTKVVFADLLNTFSTAQAYGVIWSSVTQATRYYQEGSIPRKQAANSVITNCQRYGEKAIAGGWKLKNFSRIKELPQTALSKLFYNRILGIGDTGFSEVPRKLFEE